MQVTASSKDVKAIKTGSNTITVTGGRINLLVSGAQSKGFSAKKDIIFQDGEVQIALSGAAVLAVSGSGFDPSYCTGVKTDADIWVYGGIFKISATSAAAGSKGFSADGSIHLEGGTYTMQSVADGIGYTNVLGVADIYASASFTADKHVYVSSGTIQITNSGSYGKGISADSNVYISGAAALTIANSGAAGKGVKADGNIYVQGGTTNITLGGATTLAASGSGFDPSYPSGLKASGSVEIQSGSVTISGSSSASGTKGISADAHIRIMGGLISVSTAGNGAVYKNASGLTDAYASAAITADSNIVIEAGTITTVSSGTGGKGLKADGMILVGTASSSPILNIQTKGTRFLVSGSDFSHPKTIVATKAVWIQNGQLTLQSTDDGIHSDTEVTISGGDLSISAISTTSGQGEGVEAPLIQFTGGVTRITASNDGINATYGTVVGGTESDDGSLLAISGGIIVVDGKDAIDSNGDITITGGTTVVCGVTNAPEEGLDFNGQFTMKGGTIICAGSNSNMTKNFSSSSTQRTMYLKSGAQLAASSLLHIRSSSGTEMVTFKPKNGVYYFHFSSPQINANTQYQVYFGGSYTGGSFVGNSSGWGMYTGGTYSTSGATLKSTITTSSSSTLNTVSF